MRFLRVVQRAGDHSTGNFVEVDMSFSIERYKEESKKVDVTGIAWDDVTAHPLSKGDLFCLELTGRRGTAN